jgi:sulfur relay (sulfurtransferase) DsrC/TusE family protein
LKSAERWSYAVLEQVADSFRRRIELLTEHHSLRSFTREMYVAGVSLICIYQSIDQF